VFTGNTFGNIVNGQVYYIKEIYSNTVNATQIMAGRAYIIKTLGTTDWNDIGYIGTPVVGGIFIAQKNPPVAVGTLIGSGTGTASLTEIVISTSVTFDDNNFPIPGPAYPLYDEDDENFGSMITTFDPISYADIIRQNIIENWSYTLNEIDFQIDRFIVDKQLTYDYLTDIEPSVWYQYPSATPTPDPLDSKNFYVIFPRKTILPEKNQEF